MVPQGDWTEHLRTFSAFRGGASYPSGEAQLESAVLELLPPAEPPSNVTEDPVMTDILRKLGVGGKERKRLQGLLNKVGAQ